MVRVSWLDRELRELEVTELGVGRGETFLPCTWSIEEYGVVQRSKEATPLEERQDSCDHWFLAALGVLLL